MTSVWNPSSLVGKKHDGGKELGSPGQLLSQEAPGSCPHRLDPVPHQREERSRWPHLALHRLLRPLLQLELQASEAAALASSALTWTPRKALRSEARTVETLQSTLKSGNCTAGRAGRRE